MAHVLRITDGTTDAGTAHTVTLTSGDMYLAEYTPQTAYDLSKPIRERAVVGFTTSEATIKSNVQALNRLFYQAASWHRNQSGKKIWVEFDPGTSGTAYRSQLYNGAIHPQDDALGGQWGAHNIEMELEWERWPYWEGALTQIPLTNGSATDNTSGINVDNAGDPGRWNWVSIASTDVIGDLPAACKIQMRNVTTDSSDGQEIFIFHNVYSSPATFPHILEAEDSTDGTTTTDASASGQAYQSFGWAGTTRTRIAEWTISSTDLSRAAGGRFALLARFKGLVTYSDLWLQFKLETVTTAYDLWVGSLVLASSTTDGRELRLLDTLRLPPYLEGVTTVREVDLKLYGMRNSSTNTITLDYIQLSPISGDSGWLQFRSVARGIPYSAYFIHDGTEGITYRTDANDNFMSEFTQYGGPILLVPNAAQKLYFLTSDYTGIAHPAQDWTVKVWYRPRRCSI